VKLPVALPPSAEGIAVAPDGSALIVTDGDGKPGKPCAAPATWQRLVLPDVPS
jgi:hypothetical protein